MTLAVTFPGQDSLMKIYGTFLTGHLSRFKEDVQAGRGEGCMCKEDVLARSGGACSPVCRLSAAF
jgi:hypothetical protein